MSNTNPSVELFLETKNDDALKRDNKSLDLAGKSLMHNYRFDDFSNGELLEAEHTRILHVDEN